MAAPADTKAAPSARDARRAERAPSGGWRTIAAKELADHLESTRFMVLLVVVAIAAVMPMIFISGDISANAPQLSGVKALFLAVFVAGSKSALSLTAVFLAGLLVPLVGIAFGFDAINVERQQGTLSRLLSAPIHRDDIVNGKFVGGIAVIAIMLTVLVTMISAIAMMRLGIVPSGEEVARVVIWALMTVLYASFWLAFALLLSVVVRSAATAALVGFGTWLGLAFFGQMLLPIIANVLFPVNTSGTANDYFASTTAASLFLRISPATLYQDIVQAVMNPSTTTVMGVANMGQYVSSQEALPSLLTLDQSILLVWPQIVIMVALTVAMFALAYVLFLRQEVRA